MAYRKRSFKKKRTFKGKVKAAVRKVKRTALNKIIRTQIHKAVENKTKEFFTPGRSLHPSNSPVFQDNVMPLGVDGVDVSITQGVGAGSRIGNRITVRKLMIKGTIVPNPYDATLNPNPRPMQVKLVIFYDRSNPTSEPQPYLNFFQDGGTSTTFANDLADMWRPYNTDRYRILTTRNFKLGYAAYTGSAASPANQLAYQAYTNNDFKLNHNFSIDLTKYYPKVVKFDDNNNIPTSRALWMLWYVCAADGTPFTASWNLAGVQYMTQITYEDA